ncbi:hypothetical protein [Dyadobacter diqingensis]|uniref:hypothetical protein n=1 Tax=Dyadobacter diqingensis TaxID=2938121 RepID=UPI0020C504D4|nr:hypothetical protein [Dyadobacter diqingensis]
MVLLIRKYIFIIIAFFFVTFRICYTEASVVKTGIGIFDTVFIADHAALRIHGDIYLKHAHVLGKGKLTVLGKGQNRIVSYDSEVNNLEVITNGVLTLDGALAVKQSLTVRCGVIDVNSGKLIFSDSTKIRLLGGAQILFKSVLAGLPRTNGLFHSIDFSARAILVATLILEGNTMWEIQQRNLEPPRCDSQIYKDVESAPPEGC